MPRGARALRGRADRGRALAGAGGAPRAAQGTIEWVEVQLALDAAGRAQVTYQTRWRTDGTMHGFYFQGEAAAPRLPRRDGRASRRQPGPALDHRRRRRALGHRARRRARLGARGRRPTPSRYEADLAAAGLVAATTAEDGTELVVLNWAPVEWDAPLGHETLAVTFAAVPAPRAGRPLPRGRRRGRAPDRALGQRALPDHLPRRRRPAGALGALPPGARCRPAGTTASSSTSPARFFPGVVAATRAREAASWPRSRSARRRPTPTRSGSGWRDEQRALEIARREQALRASRRCSLLVAASLLAAGVKLKGIARAHATAPDVLWERDDWEPPRLRLSTLPQDRQGRRARPDRGAHAARPAVPGDPRDGARPARRARPDRGARRRGAPCGSRARGGAAGGRPLPGVRLEGARGRSPPRRRRASPAASASCSSGRCSARPGTPTSTPPASTTGASSGSSSPTSPPWPRCASTRRRTTTPNYYPWWVSSHHADGPGVWRGEGAAPFAGGGGRFGGGGATGSLRRAPRRARAGAGQGLDGRLRAGGPRAGLRARRLSLGLPQRLSLGLPLRVSQRLPLGLPQRLPLGLPQRLRLGGIALSRFFPTAAEAASLQLPLPASGARAARFSAAGRALRRRPRALLPRRAAWLQRLGLAMILAGHLPLWVRTQTNAPGGATPEHEEVWVAGRGRLARAGAGARAPRRALGHDALGHLQPPGEARPARAAGRALAGVPYVAGDVPRVALPGARPRAPSRSSSCRSGSTACARSGTRASCARRARPWRRPAPRPRRPRKGALRLRPDARAARGPPRAATPSTRGSCCARRARTPRGSSACRSRYRSTACRARTTPTSTPWCSARGTSACPGRPAARQRRRGGPGLRVRARRKASASS